MSCKSCCAKCRPEAYWCCGDKWKCNRVRRKMCYHNRRDKMIMKNLIIFMLVVILFVTWGSIFFDREISLLRVRLPVRNRSIESQLLNVISQIEAEKQRDVAMVKVREIVEMLQH